MRKLMMILLLALTGCKKEEVKSTEYRSCVLMEYEGYEIKNTLYGDYTNDSTLYLYKSIDKINPLIIKLDTIINYNNNSYLFLNDIKYSGGNISIIKKYGTPYKGLDVVFYNIKQL